MGDWQADVEVTVTLSKGPDNARTAVTTGMTVPIPQGDDTLLAEAVRWCGDAAAKASAVKWPTVTEG